MNTRVARIAWRQAVIGGFISETSPPPTLEASEAKDKDDDDDATASEDDDDDATASEDDDDDEDISSSGMDEMSTWHFYPLSLVTKRGSSFGYESSHTYGGS